MFNSKQKKKASSERTRYFLWKW